MSSSESDYESDSFSSIQADFERLSEILQNFASDIDVLGSNLVKMQKPIENIELNQLMDVSFLENSAFRKQTFLVRDSGLSGLSGFEPNKRYPFNEICSVLRNYLFKNNLVRVDGTIVLNEYLKNLFKLENTNEGNINYLDIIVRLKNVLV